MLKIINIPYLCHALLVNSMIISEMQSKLLIVDIPPYQEKQFIKGSKLNPDL